MAFKTITQLVSTAPAAALSDTDPFETVQGGASKGGIMSLIRSYIFGTMCIMPQGRLSLTTNVPVMTADVLAATTIYYTPYVGQYVPIYNGTILVLTDIGGQLSQATTDATKSPAACANNSNYDLFVWNDAGTIRCTRGPAWTSDTGRGTGAGTTELARIKGILTNAVAITNGPVANRGTYVGTVRTDGSAQCNWKNGARSAGGTAALFNVWNMYNRVNVLTMVEDSASSWTLAATSTRSANNSAGMRVSFVIGWLEDFCMADYEILIGTDATVSASVGIGYDSTTAYATSSRIGAHITSSRIIPGRGNYAVQALGFHYLQALETAATGGTATFYNTGGQGGLCYYGKH